MDFIDAFRGLPTVSERRKVIEALVPELSPVEWRQLQQRLNARSWDCDLIAVLPYELAVEVFYYVDVVDLVVHRRVSKKWNEILRSEFLCKSILRQVFHIPSARCTPDPALQLLKLARRDYAFRWGKPYSRAKLRDKSSNDGVPRLQMAYHSGRTAWANWDAEKSVNSLTELDLLSGRRHDHPELTREHIMYITLSENLLGCISMLGSVYAIERNSRRLKRSVLASVGGISAFLSRAYLFAVVFWRERLLKITFFDYRRSLSWEVDISSLVPGYYYREKTLAFHPHKEAVIIIGRKIDSPLDMYLIQVGFDGNILSQTYFKTGWRGLEFDPCVSSDNGLLTLCMYASSEGVKASVTITMLQFDATADAVVQKTVTSDCIRPVNHFDADALADGFCKHIYALVWGDIIYTQGLGFRNRPLCAANMGSSSSTREAQQRATDGQLTDESIFHDPFLNCWWIGGDGTFVVWMDKEEAITAWSFDPEASVAHCSLKD
ncbi:MAG: hypothetical protein M1825_002133 [Sarcosagium campestre]|nr:MAG: hypothetical protein M1825_002133 [Sarcosagium campestre]